MNTYRLTPNYKRWHADGELIIEHVAPGEELRFASETFPRFVATPMATPHEWYVQDYGPNGDTIPPIEVKGSRHKHSHQAIQLADELNDEWESYLADLHQHRVEEARYHQGE